MVSPDHKTLTCANHPIPEKAPSTLGRMDHPGSQSFRQTALHRTCQIPLTDGKCHRSAEPEQHTRIPNQSPNSNPADLDSSRPPKRATHPRHGSPSLSTIAEQRVSHVRSCNCPEALLMEVTGRSLRTALSGRRGAPGTDSNGKGRPRGRGSSR
jgi:hypothetical protein